jgi:hypothetical protein
MLTCCAERETIASTTAVAEASNPSVAEAGAVGGVPSVPEAGAVGGVPSVPEAAAVAVPSFAVGDAVAVSLHSKRQTCARGLIVNEPSRDMKRIFSVRYIFFVLRYQQFFEDFDLVPTYLLTYNSTIILFSSVVDLEIFLSGPDPRM